MICTFAAGGGNYCLFISADGALMAYCSARDTHYEWGLWNVGEMLGTGRDGNQAVPFQYEEEMAALYYNMEMDSEDKPVLCMRYGKPIPEDELHKQAEAILTGIQTVIFQSDILEFDNFDGTYVKAGLYDIEPIWRDVPPFIADFMIWEVARNALE